MYNYQQLKLKNTKTKQTTRTGTESRNGRSHGGYQQGGGEGGVRGKVQGISSINGRWKVDRGRG